jgi:MFS family permease
MAGKDERMERAASDVPAALARMRSRSRAWLRGLLSYDRNVYLMLFFTLGKGLQLSIAGLVVSLYAYSLGYDKTFIGILAAVTAIGSLVAAVPTGLLADRIGRKPLVILGSLLNPLALLALGLSTQASWLLLAAFFNGVLSNAYWVTNLPILTESTSEDQRVGVLAANNFLLLGVGAMGSLIGGGVPELVAHLTHTTASSVVPLRWGLLVASFVTFLPALPLLWLREPTRDRFTTPLHAGEGMGFVASGAPQPFGVVAAETAAVLGSDDSASQKASDAGIASTMTTDADASSLPHSGVGTQPAAPTGEAPPGRGAMVKLFAQLLLPDALYTTGEGAALALLSLYFALRFHLQPGALGVFLTLAGLIGGIMSFAAPRMARRWGKLGTATTSQFLTVPVVLAIGLAPGFALAASAELLRNILRGLFEPTYAAFTMERVTARHRATLSGFYSVTWSIGFSLGASLAGWLFQHVGYSAAFVVSAALIAIAAMLLRLFFGRSEKKRI